MTPLAQSLLAQYRREATATKQQADVLLAETLASVLTDTGAVIDGVCCGYLRRRPGREVRAPKLQRPIVDAVEGEPQ